MALLLPLPDQGEAAADGPAAGGAGATVVEMTSSMTYAPATLRIGEGESVTWRNVSEVPHTVTADPSKAADPSHARLPSGASRFDSGSIPPGGEYTRTFSVPGEYRYFCIPHEGQGMVGTVIVEG